MTSNRLDTLVRESLFTHADSVDGYLVSEFLGLTRIKIWPRRRWRWRHNRTIRLFVAAHLEPERPVACVIEVV